MAGTDYAEIFEKAEVGIALNDPDRGTVGEVNERYAELMGYDRSAFRDMRIDEISADAPSFDQKRAMEKIEDALAGERKQFDWYFERADGSRFWGEVVLKRMDIGEEDRLVAFVRDISDRKQYERELERQNRRLEEFASIVAHDLRNPLNVAEGMLGQVREHCDREELDHAAAALDRMETIIEDVRSLAATGDDDDEPEPVDLGDVADRCWRMVRTETATLAVETAGSVMADESRLQQLLENLFRNAVEHGSTSPGRGEHAGEHGSTSPRDGEDVTVTVGDLDDGFYVADDGPGIPEDERDRVFEAGYSTTESGEGLGMHIVGDVAAALGWEVTVDESEEGGARFEFRGVERPG